MAKCAICEKTASHGNKLSITRSHISKRSPRTWKPNLRSVKAEVDGELRKLITPIDDLKFSARSHNSLARAEIKFFGELVLMNEKDLAEIRNLGKRSLDEIKEKMEELGYPVGTVLPEELVQNLKAKLAQLKEK